MLNVLTLNFLTKIFFLSLLLFFFSFFSFIHPSNAEINVYVYIKKSLTYFSSSFSSILHSYQAPVPYQHYFFPHFHFVCFSFRFHDKNYTGSFFPLFFELYQPSELYLLFVLWMVFHKMRKELDIRLDWLSKTNKVLKIRL